jgi:cyclase
MKTRIIAKLDAKPPHIVKPVHFEGLRKIGRPDELAERYYKQGADEVMYIDIVASLYQREILYKQIEEAGKDIYIPFAVGGGVRSVEDFSKLFHSGADKVVINTHAVQNDPEIISRASRIFGAQAVVVNIEAKKWDDWWECYTDCGRIRSGRNVLEWVEEVEKLGAGEIVVQSVDKDGRKRGFDIELIKQVLEKVNIPVVAASGAGKLEDILDVIKRAKPNAVAVSSVLHYDITTIGQLKAYLTEHGVEVAK